MNKPNVKAFLDSLFHHFRRLPSIVSIGFLTFSTIIITSLAIYYENPDAIPSSGTFSNKIANKALPIYCVDTPKKQVALSFDAAWGDGRLLKI